MGKTVVITGGAGFIGSHLCDALIARGDRVIVVDDLLPTVHTKQRCPAYLNPLASFVQTNVSDTQKLLPLIEKADVVYHYAAGVGVGQSQYDISSYAQNNIQATAELLHCLVTHKIPLHRFIIAGSMSSYGEGLYVCDSCKKDCSPRGPRVVNNKQWDPLCRQCGKGLRPIPTPEHVELQPASIYAITKRTQEEMALVVGRAHNIPVTVLRFFNVFGSRQSLSNPYTGVIAIFVARSIQGLPLRVFEDGEQKRDFVAVEDVVQASLLAMDQEEAVGEIFNVGSGKPITIAEVARHVLSLIHNSKSTIEITQEFRSGDIRHCFADISKISRLLGYKPSLVFPQNLDSLIRWAVKEEITGDLEKAYNELMQSNLVYKVK